MSTCVQNFSDKLLRWLPCTDQTAVFPANVTCGTPSFKKVSNTNRNSKDQKDGLLLDVQHILHTLDLGENKSLRNLIKIWGIIAGWSEQLITALHCTATHCSALEATNTLHCTILHCAAQHYNTLHCTTLHWTRHYTEVCSYSCIPAWRVFTGFRIHPNWRIGGR